ncbi:MAG: NTP transferase domain-containing protein [Bacilli bacterium]|nr:NTP transferase domain-containing protein [Bacilli bacterium]
MKDLTLVVMAAGMGSRFGGLKQITPVDEDGNFIIDYSVYDAKKAGFNKVVFVIKEENLHDFESTIGKRLRNQIEVEYAFQKLEDVPRTLDLSNRKKPWGTVQAVLCAKKYVNGAFVVINADDFYGYDSFFKAAQFLSAHDQAGEYASIAYPFGVTKSDVGAVKRGVLEIEDGRVHSIIESSIEVIDDEKALASPLDGSEPFEILINAPVSMNMFAFQHDFFEKLEVYFEDFFAQEDDVVLSCEALLPDCIEKNIKSHEISVYVVSTNGQWLGMTYQEDLKAVKEKIHELKEKHEYPTNLWS